jgi:hypothetical protein
MQTGTLAAYWNAVNGTVAARWKSSQFIPGWTRNALTASGVAGMADAGIEESGTEAGKGNGYA